jgi:hypothetical protein
MWGTNSCYVRTFQRSTWFQLITVSGMLIPRRTVLAYVPIVSDYQYKAINVSSKNQVRHMTIEDSQGKMSFMNLFYILLVMATFASY